MSLKLGISKHLKIKSIVRLGFSWVLLSFLFVQTGCERAIIYPGEMTQTAQALFNNPVLETPPTAQAMEINTTDEPETGLPDSTPQPTSTLRPTRNTTEHPPILYYSQSGDTIKALAIRFQVQPDEIISPDPLDPNALIQPNQLLIIPNEDFETGPSDRALPDSEIIYSPSTIGFSTEDYAKEAGGYLSTYKEWIDHWYTGSEIIERVALENSINPKLFLCLLEYQSHWVYGQPTNMAEVEYPMGWNVLKNHGLYLQLTWAARMLSTGYYGWRTGEMTSLTYNDGTTVRLAPELNAGTVALQNFFAHIENPEKMGGHLYSPEGLPALYEKMFGDPWARAQSIEPLFPPNLSQPTLEYPFLAGHTWTLTGGPHYAWFHDAGSVAALDFAPPTNEPGCSPADEMVTSVGPGIVTRSDRGVVVVDMDGDGNEQTGWSIFYLHIGNEDRVPVGKKVVTNEPIGHPSCVGGDSTGTHLHIARKYNGEWMAADGPVPFVLSGWRAMNGPKPYKGYLVKDDQIITANENIGVEALVTRPTETIQITPVSGMTTPSP